MRYKFVKITIFLLLSLSFLFSGIKDKRKELENTRRRLKKVRAEISKLTREKKNILKKLSLLEEKEELTGKLLTQLIQEEKQTLNQINIIEKSIDSLNTEVKRLREDVNNFILKYYIYRRIIMKNFFNIANPSEYFRKVVLLKRFTLEDKKKIEYYLLLEESLRKKREELQKNIEYLGSIKEEKNQEIDSLRMARLEKRNEIKRIENEKRKKKKLEKELLAAQRRLENLISRMERERKKKSTGKKEKSYVKKKGKGTLDWPCKGKVVAGFGLVRHPRYGTKIKNQGIDIKCSGKVKAVLSGTVVFSDKYLGYGNMVIISHGKGYYSVYSNLDGVRVKSGNKVKKGDVIGTCNDILHFEWRVNARSVDPLKWLK